MEPFVQKQYDDYQANYVEKEVMSKYDLRQKIIDDLSYVSKMSVGEYTLYQKYLEIQQRYPSQEMGTLFGAEKQLINEDHIKLINESKNNIWFPEDPMDFEKLEPELIYTDSIKDRQSAGSLTEKWNCVRTFTSTMKNSSNIGRNLHYLVRDKVSGKYLGVICITGDFIDLTPRDNFIGWEREYKTNSGKLNNSCIGSTIVPLQPLGFNYTGGKLLALLCLSDDIQNQWQENYGDKLVSVTTTSLYGKSKTGGLSQYDRLKHWKKMGYSQGSLSYELTKETEKEMLKYAEKHYNDRYFMLYVAKRENGQTLKRDHRNRMRQFIYSQLKIPKDIIKSEHQRGIYYSTLYDNSREFLRGEIEEKDLVKSFDTSTEALSELWKEKYARKRINNLVKNDRTNLTETLFYDDVCFMTWAETKAKYLGEVGR
tara:strand:+ start:10953 stop:12230 length:1278 start_codon:yes stop_codon:yes gene_type:complete